MDNWETLTNTKEKLRAVTNLYSLAETVRTYGIDDSLREFLDGDGAMTAAFGIEFTDENRQEILKRIDTYFDSTSTEGFIVDIFKGIIKWIMKGIGIAIISITVMLFNLLVLSLTRIFISMVGSIVKKTGKLVLLRNEKDVEQKLDKIGKWPSRPEFEEEFAKTQKGIKKLLSDIDDECQNLDPNDYANIAHELGYGDLGDKPKRQFTGHDLIQYKNTLRALDWTVRDINNYVRTIQKDSDDLDRASREAARLRDEAEKRIEEIKKESSGSEQETSREEKKKRKKMVQDKKEEAVRMANAVQAILMKYMYLIDILIAIEKHVLK